MGISCTRLINQQSSSRNNRLEPIEKPAGYHMPNSHPVDVLAHSSATTPMAGATAGRLPGSIGINNHGSRHVAHRNRKHKRARLKHMDPVAAAFLRAEKEGWVKYFLAEGEGENGGLGEAFFSSAILMAVAYRETGLQSKYLTIAGDNGNGYGLMQADKRSYPDWIEAGSWKDAQKCIELGAKVLADKRKQIFDGQGKSLSVRSSKSGIYSHFVGKAISGTNLLAVSIAAYNAGLWPYYSFSKGSNIDQYTTQANYSKDVLQNSMRFAILLQGRFFPSHGSPYDTNLSHFA